MRIVGQKGGQRVAESGRGFLFLYRCLRSWLVYFVGRWRMGGFVGTVMICRGCIHGMGVCGIEAACMLHRDRTAEGP